MYLYPNNFLNSSNQICFNSDEFDDIIINSYYSNNKLIVEAFNDELKFRIKSNQEIKILLNEINILFSKTSNIDNIKVEVINYIDSQIQFIIELNKNLEQYSSNIESFENSFYPLFNNKMNLVLDGAKIIVSNHIAEILQGNLPKNYQLSDQILPLITDNEFLIYGSSKATYFKAALLEIKRYLSDNKNLWINDYETWVDDSAIAHIVTIPDKLDIGNFVNSGYYFCDQITPKALVTIHSGYAFGGHRSDNRFQNLKKFSPEDCSSWIAKLLNCKNSFSTIDLFKLYIQDESSNDTSLREVKNLLVPIYVKNPITDIKSGMIYGYREFGEDQTMNGFGKGGHVGIILGISDFNHIWVISDKRDMPEVEGYVIKKFPINNFYKDGYHEVFYLGVIEEQVE